jgi:hypothetical protein
LPSPPIRPAVARALAAIAVTNVASGNPDPQKWIERAWPG